MKNPIALNRIDSQTLKGFICVLAMLLSLSVTATNSLTLEGLVASSDGPLPGATIHIKGTETVTVTDKEGKFKFPVELKSGDVLVFSFIGLETQELVITDETPSYIEITLSQGDIYIADAPMTAHQPYKRPSIATRLWAKVKSVF